MAIALDQQNIIASLGLQSLPEEQKLGILDKLTQLVEKRLLVRVLDSLSEQDQDQFAKLLEAENQDSVNAFLEQHVPDLGKWAEEETQAVKQEAVSWVDELLKQ